LYALLTGRGPFDGKDTAESLALARQGYVEAARQVNPRVPAALSAICQRAMSQRPQDRYANALDLAAEIEHWLADEPVAAFAEPGTLRFGRWRRRHRALVSGIAAAVLVTIIGVGVGMFWYQGEQNRQAAAQALRGAEAARKQAAAEEAILLAL